VSLSFQTSREPGQVVLTVAGEIDLATRDELRHALDERLDAGDSHLVLDLTAVPFIDSTGLGVLIGARRDAEAKDGYLRLVIVNAHVVKVFSVTNLDSVFDIYPTLDEALAAGE
jgi:anti-sigma B factor antagonist